MGPKSPQSIFFKSTNKTKTHVSLISKGTFEIIMDYYYATGPMALWPFHGKI